MSNFDKWFYWVMGALITIILGILSPILEKIFNLKNIKGEIK